MVMESVTEACLHLLSSVRHGAALPPLPAVRPVNVQHSSAPRFTSARRSLRWGRSAVWVIKLSIIKVYNYINIIPMNMYIIIIYIIDVHIYMYTYIVRLFKHVMLRKLAWTTWWISKLLTEVEQLGV